MTILRSQTSTHTLLPHPATLQLLRYQAAAQLLRTWHRFRGPRRLLLSLLAILLAVVWLGQVVAGLLFREPADPQKLAVWIPLGLLAYTLWHLLKTACRQPIEPFEWTPAERELLGGAPLRRQDLVMYRLIAIAAAAMAKAACFSLVMLPDLQVWLAGLAGMLMALLFVDLIRMAMEIAAYGMGRKAFFRFRVTVLGVAGIGIGLALINALPVPQAAWRSELPASLVVALRILNALLDLRNTWIGGLAEAPFEVFATTILAPSVSAALGARLLLAAGLVASMIAAVLALDQFFSRCRVASERRAFRLLRIGQVQDRETCPAPRHGLRPPRRIGGVGSLAWRQALGAVHYRTSLAVSLIVPGLLSCLTLLTPQSGCLMLVQLVGGLVFYSFLLLPTALKFDFRRDIDRLATLKALPISPLAVTLGQLTMPVFLCTLFQIVVLLVALALRPYHLALFIAAMLVLAPTNVLIFALENLIFLLYPYRLNQEGLGVFFRSILAFTAKSILFAGALALALAWAFVSKQIAGQLVPRSEWVGTSAVFIAGSWLLLTAAACGATALLAGVYRRFDPSQDTPAMS